MKRLVLTLVLAFGLSGIAIAAESTGGVTATKLIQSGSSWDGNKLPAYPAGTPQVTILRINIPAGAKLPMHYHPVINAGVLLSGELTVFSSGGKTNILKAGDALVELVNTDHYGQNTGTTDAEIIVFYAGTENNPITVKR